ncbi:MAG: multi-sensor signal transduction histidine kinase [Pedosphaera sp.]|nr:multi-sensor signal transduction histidine kinase [Pedosphaera sp.]
MNKPSTGQESEAQSQQLHQTERYGRYFQAICNNASVALFIVDERQQCVYMNPAAEELTGFTFAEARGRALHAMIHHTRPDGRPYPLAECPIDRAFPENNQQQGEEIFVHKNGHFYTVAYTASPIREAGGVVGTVVEVRDISKQKRDEEAFREQARSLEIVNEVGTALTAELDLAKLVQAATDAGTEITGAQFGAFFYNVINERGEAYTLYTLSGVPREMFDKFPMPRATQLFGPTFRGEGIIRIGDVLQDARYGKNEPYHGMPKGHLPVRSYLAVPVVSRSGTVLGGLFFGHSKTNVFTEQSESILKAIASQAAIAIDNAQLYQAVQRELAEQKRAEEALRESEQALKSAQAELKQHAEELEQKVEERTTSLREAAAQMEEFSYSVSHDLRAPLRAMQGYSKVLLDEYGDRLGEGRSYLERIIRSGERMDLLTQEVLTLSRLSREEVELKQVSMDRLVHDVIQAYPAFQSPQAEIEVKPLLDVVGQESLLSQVISNLLGNAVKFVKPGIRPRIRIWTELREERVWLWVEDNGIGIKPEYQKRIFGIFERVHSEGKYEGTGIGLAIVRKAVERMGGSVGIESDGVNGSRFWIQLGKPVTA